MSQDQSWRYGYYGIQLLWIGMITMVIQATSRRLESTFQPNNVRPIHEQRIFYVLVVRENASGCFYYTTRLTQNHAAMGGLGYWGVLAFPRGESSLLNYEETMHAYTSAV
jgi:hypothetical protein